MLNAYWGRLTFAFPIAGERGNRRWRRWIDTSLPCPDDICTWKDATSVTGTVYPVEPRSLAVLLETAQGALCRNPSLHKALKTAICAGFQTGTSPVPRSPPVSDRCLLFRGQETEPDLKKRTRELALSLTDVSRYCAIGRHSNQFHQVPRIVDVLGGGIVPDQTSLLIKNVCRTAA